jgi:hypothetical protein
MSWMLKLNKFSRILSVREELKPVEKVLAFEMPAIKKLFL